MDRDQWKIMKENSNYQINTINKEIRNLKTKKIIKPRINKNYYKIDLYQNGKRKTHYLHRLIYNNLVGDLTDDQIIDHINNNSLDNSLDNLRIVTQSQNKINSKYSTDFIEISEEDQVSLIVLDLDNEVFFYEKLKLFVRKIINTKFRILGIQYRSQYCNYIRYTKKGKNFSLNITKYLFPELATNVNFVLINSDGIYFDEKARKFYRYNEKTGLYKELAISYYSPEYIRVQYMVGKRNVNLNVYGYLHKNSDIEIA